MSNTNDDADDDNTGSISGGGGPNNIGGTAFEPNAAHVAAVEKTKGFTVESMPNYQNRIMHIVLFIQTDYPHLVPLLVYELPDDVRKDPRYHFHKATHSIKWNNYTPAIMQSFMSGAMQWKDKEKGIKYTYDHLRKYHDAVLKCSEYSPYNYALPSTYKKEMKPYLTNLKKELAKAKSEGKVAEQDADPICFSLFEQICIWAVMSGQIFVWVFLVLQWNLMARASNVDSISFSNFWSKNDTILFKYDTNKKDRAGEHTTEKHCYANPLNPFVCLFLAMGCYLCINQQKYEQNSSNSLFRAQGKDKSASNSFSKALHKLIKFATRSADVLDSHSVREGHFGPHGVRKGAITHVTTGSMDGPPLPSILHRGEWSMGKVMDIYARFCSIGDTYLGRCLAGLLPDKPNFDILPPHFSVGIENKHVNEAMKQCFGVILDKHSGEGIQGCLLLFLASIVYHNEWLKSHIAKGKSHPFLQIPILNNSKLLEELEKLVTLEPAGAVKSATGVPATVAIREEVRDAVKLLHEYRKEVQWLKDNMVNMMKDAMEQKYTENGNITASFVEGTVSRLVGKVIDQVAHKMEESEARLMARLDETSTCNTGDTREVTRAVTRATPLLEAQLYPTYTYHDPNATGRNKNNTSWDVPLHFTLQTSGLFEGFRAWLTGYPAESTVTHTTDSAGNAVEVTTRTPVKPMRLLKNGRLPKQFKKAYDNNYKPVMEVLEEAVESDIVNRHVDEMDHSFLRSTYERAFDAACVKYPDFRTGIKKNWKVSTFCKKVRETNTAENTANGTKRSGGKKRKHTVVV